MICVECASPVNTLYTYYSKDNIHATKCSHCGHFADKYIECDRILTFIDLLLLRKAAIRHVVFNASNASFHQGENVAWQQKQIAEGSREFSSGRPGEETQFCFRQTIKPSRARQFFGLSPTVLRLILFVIMVDVYLRWATSERSSSPIMLEFLTSTHPILQHVVFITLSFSDTIVSHLVVRGMSRLFTEWKDGAALSTSLLIGSFFKLLPILTLIWDQSIPYSDQIVEIFSLYCVTEVLSVTMGCGYICAALFTFTAHCFSVLSHCLFLILVRS